MKLLVTSALPYANGPIHLGHLVEYLQTDIFVRHHRMRGTDVRYFCADDTHGTPIELNARARGVTPEALVEQFGVEHLADFTAFGIEFDRYHSTNSPENRRHAGEIYAALQRGGYVARRGLEQLYCPKDERFLPDRYVKGTCPRCEAPDQYGDVCERCNSTYEPTALVSPRCALCGTAPEVRTSEHLFVELGKFTAFLTEFIQRPGVLQPEIQNFVQKWVDDGLRDWCVSRDAPYFGFEIPGETKKYFYVWLDAPVGYIATTDKWCSEHGESLDAWWRSPDTRIVHVIGKDIVYFHTLFWPAMLHAAGLSTPSRVQVHGMLTVGGEKMSKSRGTFVTARRYLDHLDPEWLRYYYAANLGPRPDDLDLNPAEFATRVNAELKNNLGNLAQRVLSFCETKLGGRLTTPEDGPLLQHAVQKAAEAAAAYDQFDFRRAVALANDVGREANEYVQRCAPWAQLKAGDTAGAARTITTAANALKIVACMVKPIAPRFAAGVEAQLAIAPLTWADAKADLAEHTIGKAAPLVREVERAAVEAIFVPESSSSVPAPAPAAPAATPALAPAATPGAASTAPTAAGAPPASTAATAEAPAPAPLEPLITLDDFKKVDLRVGLVAAAERVPKSDKLLKLTVDLGFETRTVVAGIGKAYTPEQMVGKRLMIVANLQPAKLMGVESRGMVLAAGPGGADLVIAEFPGPAAPGTRVK